jgi:hypothetical protein
MYRNSTISTPVASCWRILASLDFGDILKFRTLGARIGCATSPNSGDFAHIVGWNTKAGPCVGGALAAAVIRLIYKHPPTKSDLKSVTRFKRYGCYHLLFSPDFSNNTSFLCMGNLLSKLERQSS